MATAFIHRGVEFLVVLRDSFRIFSNVQLESDREQQVYTFRSQLERELNANWNRATASDQ